ncbi:MAG: hypothetical protein H6741_32130 [Alphaproteobacteria bacterium]|nr:hypothetical protein [Alphaproteobacteria bacterium]MCB9797362.1 hypothetical protein [Alphaproteobacteria bacterium]
MRRALILLIVGLLAALTPSDAFAQSRRPLDPEIRLHAGPSMMPGPSGVGGIFGMDSRLTRVIYMDVGGLVSPVPIAGAFFVEDDALPREHFRLRHAIYVAPGLRMPHRQPSRFHWDATFRFGATMVWSTDVSLSQAVYANSSIGRRLEFDAGGLVGLELMLLQPPKGVGARFGRVGVRASGRTLVYLPFFEDELDDVLVWTPQVGLEGVYQF